MSVESLIKSNNFFIIVFSCLVLIGVVRSLYFPEEKQSVFPSASAYNQEIIKNEETAPEAINSQTGESQLPNDTKEIEVKADEVFRMKQKLIDLKQKHYAAINELNSKLQLAYDELDKKSTALVNAGIQVNRCQDRLIQDSKNVLDTTCYDKSGYFPCQIKRRN